MCQSFILDEKSKHCGACNRCSNGFDHHCRWLNNCIGEQNYRLFIIFSILVVLLNIAHLIIMSIALSFLYPASNHSEGNNPSPDALLTLLSLPLPALLLLSMLYLLSFHAYLALRGGFSTYEYILWKRLRDRLIAKTKVSEIIMLTYAFFRRGK